MAGNALTSGSGNVFLGYQTAISNTTGSDNTVIGYGADMTDGLTNAGAIGAFSNVTASNSLVLGGTGANAVNVGIGVTAPNSTLHVNGSITVKRTATAASYTALTSDYIIAVTSTAAPRTITLPAAATVADGKVYVIIDESGGAAINNITIDANA